MSRTQVLVLSVLALGFALYGWASTYVTLSSDAPQAYVPYVLKAFLSLGVSEAILIFMAVRGKGLVRHLALGALLLNCFAIFNNTIHASYVLFSA